VGAASPLALAERTRAQRHDLCGALHIAREPDRAEVMVQPALPPREALASSDAPRAARTPLDVAHPRSTSAAHPPTTVGSAPIAPPSSCRTACASRYWRPRSCCGLFRPSRRTRRRRHGRRPIVVVTPPPLRSDDRSGIEPNHSTPCTRLMSRTRNGITVTPHVRPRESAHASYSYCGSEGATITGWPSTRMDARRPGSEPTSSTRPTVAGLRSLCARGARVPICPRRLDLSDPEAKSPGSRAFGCCGSSSSRRDLR
jgi:hypothetical protein